jgi:hypothetical protein
MLPVRLIGVIAAGLGLAFWLDSKKEKTEKISAPEKSTTEKGVTREEIKRVMSHFGKRSGEARGSK